MIPVFVERAYSQGEGGEMRRWCNAHIVGMWSSGCPTATILGADVPEIPWEFEREEDAIIFTLRWK